MDILEFSWTVIQDQGMVAFLLLVLIWQLRAMMHDQNDLTKEILKKNCEMNKFLMTCLEREINEDHDKT